ncbi:unnamed protein product, partial [Oppiella nova]
MASNQKLCLVCGDKALSNNFCAITCESCKAFFRRNATKLDECNKCPFDDKCEVNVHNRRLCRRCRLRKCYAVGMKHNILDISLLTPSLSPGTDCSLEMLDTNDFNAEDFLGISNNTYRKAVELELSVLPIPRAFNNYHSLTREEWSRVFELFSETVKTREWSEPQHTIIATTIPEVAT